MANKTTKRAAAKKAGPRPRKADPFAAIKTDLQELAARDDVPKAYAGRLQAIANRIDNAVDRTRQG